MVQSVTIGVVTFVLLAGGSAGLIAQSAVEENRFGACQDYAGRNLAKAAQKEVDQATRDLEAVRHGGSLYAAAKLGIQPDPTAMALARSRLDQALKAREAAFKACAAQPAA